MGSGAGDKKEEKKEDTDKTVLDASNAGYKMLSKMGWKPGKGLGAKEDGKVAPVGAAKAASDKSGAAAGSAHGVGSQHTWDLDGSEDVYEQYRKRMSQNPFWNVFATEMTSEGYPVRPGQGDCSFYMKTGQCKLGARCKWNHPHKGVSTFENVYLGTGACGAPNDLDAGAGAARLHAPLEEPPVAVTRVQMVSDMQLEGGGCRAIAKIHIPARLEDGRHSDVRGILLGPGGSTLKRLISESGCHLALRGRGSCCDACRCRSCVENAHKPPHLQEQLHVRAEYEGLAQWRDLFLNNAELLIRAALAPGTDTPAGGAGAGVGAAETAEAKAADSALPNPGEKKLDKKAKSEANFRMLGSGGGTAADAQPPAEPAGNAAAPKKRSRWDTKTETADAAAGAPCGGEDGGDAKRGGGSSEKQHGPVGCNSTCSLFVYNCPAGWDDEAIKQTFSPYGAIVSATIIKDKSTGASKRFGFVNFDNPITAQQAQQGMNGHEVDEKEGNRLKVQLTLRRLETVPPSQGLKEMATTEMTSEGYPVRPGQGDCSFYMKTGQCKLGARCKWNHPHKGVSTFENVYLGTGACGAPNDLDAGACAAKHARAQWMVPYKQTSSQVERRVLESLSRGGTRCTCIRVSSILLSSRVELHSRSSPNKWRTHEALHAFFSNPANSFLSNPANSGKPQVLLPPAEPEAAYIAFDNYEHLRHFTRFRQQLIGGMRVRLEPVQRTQCPDGQWLTLCASPAAIAGATATPTGAADCSCPPPGRAAQQVDLSIYLSIYVCVCMCVCM